VQSLKEAVDLFLLCYTAGRASYFEVLESEQLLFPAEDALAQTQRDQLLAVVDLYEALGWRMELQRRRVAPQTVISGGRIRAKNIES